MTDPFDKQPPPDGPQYGAPGTGPQYGAPGTGPQYGQPYGQQPVPGQQPFAQPGQPYGQPSPFGTPGPMGPYGGDPEAPYGRDPFGVPLSDKSKLTAGLLQLLIGSLGIGRFYLGYTTIGVLQLVTCGGCGVWALIDGILILIGKVPDPQGRPLRD
ncbi:TM2 domain-containing protein [Nocardia aurantiaca]|uniref:NINE protein n=1 Tax=Nocardia aurantiaca TaxID=2675850 RepID=A0A6I3KZP5_9NOCA|nr:NINE protein [Nocardia aurantiaca]